MALQVAVLVMLGTATKLQTARQINGTNFDGTGNITTAKWGTARTIALSGAVSGSASVNGSGNVTITTSQANIAVLTGNFTAAADTAANVKNLNYPSGFTKDNCVVLAYGKYYYATTGYSFGHHSNNSAGMLFGTNDNDITLGDTITLWYNNISSSSVKIYYKIVLMKVS